MDYAREYRGHEHLQDFISFMYYMNLCSLSSHGNALNLLWDRMSNTRNMQDLQVIWDIATTSVA